MIKTLPAWLVADAFYWWRLGRDTAKIAAILNRGKENLSDQRITEAAVYNSLSRFREVPTCVLPRPLKA